MSFGNDLANFNHLSGLPASIMVLRAECLISLPLMFRRKG